MNFEKIIKIIIFTAMAIGIIVGTCEAPTVRVFEVNTESTCK